MGRHHFATGLALTFLLAIAGAVRSQDEPPASPPTATPPQPEIERKFPVAVGDVACSPDGKWVAACSQSHVVLFSTESDERRVLRSAPRTKDKVYTSQILFSGDSRFLVILEYEESVPDKSLRAFDLQRDGRVATIAVPETKDARGKQSRVQLVVPETGSTSVTVVRDRTAETWDLATERCTGTLEFQELTSSVRRTRDGSVTVEAFLGRVDVLETSSRKRLWHFDLDPRPFKPPAFEAIASWHPAGCTPDAKVLVGYAAWTERDKTTPRSAARIEACDARTGASLWYRPAEGLFDQYFSVGADALAVWDFGKIHFFDLATGKPLGRPVTSLRTYTALTVSADGKSFWAGTANGRVVRVAVPAAAK